MGVDLIAIASHDGSKVDAALASTNRCEPHRGAHAPPALRSMFKTRSSAIRSRVRVDDREMQPDTWQKPGVDDAAEQPALPEGLHLGPSGSWKRCFKLGVSVDCPRVFRNRVQLECRCDYQEISEDRARHRAFVDTAEGRYDAGVPHLVA